ncbi:MAG TPA: hypothetical protein VNG33_22345, partial [Polyangiaceae bacterium]|nr:hypothetical protein [Polyangiaceae bacterium]
AFPQVKIGHLRALPAPPALPARSRIAELASQAGVGGLTAELRLALDSAVFDIFGISPDEAAEIKGFVRSLSPLAGLTAPLA